MALKYNIPFATLIKRSVDRRKKLVNNYHYAPKTGRHGVPCVVQTDSVYCPQLDMRIRIPVDFAGFLKTHEDHIVIYWPRNKDHNNIIVSIDSKHTRPLQILYAEYIGRRIVNTEWVIRAGGVSELALNEQTTLPVGGYCEEFVVRGKSVVWLVPNTAYLPTLFTVTDWLKAQLPYASLTVTNSGWKLQEFDEHGIPGKGKYIPEAHYPEFFNA